MAAGYPDGSARATATLGSCAVMISVDRKLRPPYAIAPDEPCYRPLEKPIRTADGKDRELTAQEARNLLQLGVHLLALEANGRSRTASRIWHRLGFEHCAAAVAMANSVLKENLPTPTA